MFCAGYTVVVFVFRFFRVILSFLDEVNIPYKCTFYLLSLHILSQTHDIYFRPTI